MEKHILQKKHEYAKLFSCAMKVGFSKADFRYYIVMDANENMRTLELAGEKTDWATECLKAAEKLVHEYEQGAAEAEAEAEVERAYERHLENQGEPEGYGPNWA